MKNKQNNTGAGKLALAKRISVCVSVGIVTLFTLCLLWFLYPYLANSGYGYEELGQASVKVTPLSDHLTFDSTSLTSSSSTVRVEATVLPTTASNKEVDFTYAWADESSTWASGKTVSDYLTVEQTEDGATTADITCLQAFGEPIIITVTSRANTSVTATSQVDYAQRIIPSLNIQGSSEEEYADGWDFYNDDIAMGNSVIYLPWGSTEDYSDWWTTEYTKYTDGAYTVTNAVKSYYVEIRFSEAWAGSVQSWTTMESGSLTFTEIVELYDSTITSAATPDYDAYLAMMSKANSVSGADLQVRVTANMTYGGAMTYTYNCCFQTVDIEVESVSLESVVM